MPGGFSCENYTLELDTAKTISDLAHGTNIKVNLLLQD